MRTAIFTALALSACGGPTAAPTPGDTLAGTVDPLLPIFAGGSTGRHIVCTIGDSTCVPAMALLQQMRPDLLIANHCREGAETAEMVDHQWAKNSRAMQNCDVMAVLGGVNDVGHNLDVPQAYGRLLGIADEAVALGIDAYVIVTLPYRAGVPFGSTTFGGQTYLQRMDAMQTGLRTAATPVHLVDLVADFNAHQELYMGGSDYIHPGELGQAAIAEALAEAIP